MSVEHVEVLVEEPSAEAALALILPKLLGEVSFAVRPFQCKAELLTQFPKRLRGYARWMPKTWRIVVLVDCDDDDCTRLKAQMEDAAERAGLTTPKTSAGAGFSVVNRLAIEELEAWYFGDWEAVRAAYPRVSAQIPLKAPYRDPDGINGTWEAFEKVLKKAGYFKTGLRKIEAARSVARHFRPDENRSKSFQVFRDALRDMVRT